MKPASELGTDVESLLDHLGDTPLHYVDIQSREAGRRALKQWPLLAELRTAGVRTSENAATTAPLPGLSK
jgi:hypothetical protein